MANSQLCKVCETEGVATPSDWLITAQSNATGFDPGFTIWVCNGCLFGLMHTWVMGQQEDPPAVPEPVPEGPGVLEQIETVEGAQQVSSGNGRGRKSGGKEQEPPPVEDSQETTAAHVDE